jgi:hypothetical protein
MLALPILVALALAVLALSSSVANARMARAQEVSPPPGAEVERLFREYERLMRLQPVRVETAPMGPQTDWTSRPC